MNKLAERLSAALGDNRCYAGISEDAAARIVVLLEDKLHDRVRRDTRLLREVSEALEARRL